ncbi:hypothetical protein L7F22_066114 [Adiantum nelumboides]|nr:hypothetical protein [Adiantum nelumboides]
MAESELRKCLNPATPEQYHQLTETMTKSVFEQLQSAFAPTVFDIALMTLGLVSNKVKHNIGQITRKLHVAVDKDEHTTTGPRKLAVDYGDIVLTLLECQAREIAHDVLHARDLLALESEHRAILVERR